MAAAASAAAVYGGTPMAGVVPRVRVAAGIAAEGVASSSSSASTYSSSSSALPASGGSGGSSGSGSSGGSGSGGLTLDLEASRFFGIAVTWPPSLPLGAVDERVNGASFCEGGGALVTSHNDDVLRVYSGEEGRQIGELPVKDTGCRHVTFTHHDSVVLHAAARGEGDAAGVIASHSLADNKVVRLYRGHTEPVVAIAVCPGSDAFLSVARDGKYRLWDLREPNCVAVGDTGTTKGGAMIAYDRSGAVFAVAAPNRTLQLWDPRYLAKPFEQVAGLLEYTLRPVPVTAADGTTVPPPPRYPPQFWCAGMEFSPDGHYIALATYDRGILVVDSYAPSRELALLQAHAYDPRHPCNISFSPDGRLLTTGGCDGHVYAYDLSGKPDGIPCAFDRSASDPPLEKLPYMPRRWDPPVAIMGEAYKSAGSRAAAWTGASKQLQAMHHMAHTMGSGLPAQPIELPAAAGIAEQVSRLEGPVRCLRWHPTSAVLAAGAHAVTLFMPPAGSREDAVASAHAATAEAVAVAADAAAAAPAPVAATAAPAGVSAGSDTPPA